jgi:hypothetical protein
LPSEFSSLTGWARHQHFGLRSEWVALYSEHPTEWKHSGLLGPAQIRSLCEWLVTTGLTRRDGTGTALAALADSPERIVEMWAMMWVNVVFGLATAYWYVCRVGTGSSDTTTLAARLHAEIPRLSLRTCRNAVYALVGLLERTPIGAELGQGLVSPTRPRTVRRVGLADPHPAALAHAMRRLFQRERCPQLPLHRDLLWPWVVFGCDPQETLLRLTAAGHGWLAIDSDRARLLIPWEELHELALF